MPSVPSPTVVGGSSAATGHTWVDIFLLGIIIAVGAAFGLNGIATSTMTHNEIYIPGIALPYEVSDSRPRHTIVGTVASTIHNEPHPPGYYLHMIGGILSPLMPPPDRLNDPGC